MEYKLPLIIKETLGEDTYNEMQQAIDMYPNAKDYIIYTSPEMIDAFNKEIKKNY